MTWIIEDTAFSGGDALLPALKKLNKDVILWNDDFWNDGQYKDFPNESIFHGSLENASKLNKAKLPNIISLCNEEQFSYSYLFKNYSEYLLNQHPLFTTIAELMDNPSILNRISTEKFFARPDSPLKAFSGRLLGKTNLTPAHFDYGFYHSDINLPIVLSEYKEIEKEWRFVCVNRKIITGCEYVADGRKGVSKLADRQNEPAWNLAQNIADMNRQDDFAYVIDICLSSGQLHLVEMNPFSGADLYLCDAEAIISAIEQG